MQKTTKEKAIYKIEIRQSANGSQRYYVDKKNTLSPSGWEMIDSFPLTLTGNLLAEKLILRLLEPKPEDHVIGYYK